jgi:hypothetical protein
LTPLRKSVSSAFWENFAAANETAVDVMGEEILLDGEPVNGVVEPQGYQEGAAAGGRKTLVNCRVLVSAAVVAALPLRDGMPARVRGLDGRVNGWENLGPGAGVMLDIGPYNRWSGDVPGV